MILLLHTKYINFTFVFISFALNYILRLELVFIKTISSMCIIIFIIITNKIKIRLKFI